MEPLQSQKRRRVLWVILILVVGFFFFDPAGAGSAVRAKTRDLMAPFVQGGSVIGERLSHAFALVASIGHIRSDNEGLRKEVAALTAKLTVLEGIAAENATLREMVHLPAVQEQAALGADVIVRDAFGDGWIMIDRGRREGVHSGDPVVTADEILVGFVHDVSETTARVMLITHTESVLQVQHKGSQQSAVARGTHGLTLTIEHIPLAVDVQEGDAFTSNVRDREGHLIRVAVARVQEIQQTEDRLAQEAQAMALYDPLTLDHVFLFIPSP